MKKLLLIIIAAFLFSTVEAGKPFAPKANSYSQSGFKKYGKKKNALPFAKVHNRNKNRKGLTR